MELKNQTFNINISTGTILKTIFLFVALYLLFLVKDILIILFVSLILASALDPWVDWMEKRKIPRGIGIIFIYLAMLSVISFIVYSIIPPIIKEASDLVEKFPHYVEKIFYFKESISQYGLLDNLRENLGTISSNLRGAAGGVFSTVSGIFGGIFSFFLVLVITFYMVTEENALKKLIWSVVPGSHQVYAMQLVNRMQRKIGLWLRGQLILNFVIFLMTYIGLAWFFKMDYALVLALIAGVTEMVPYLGPILGAVPAVFLAFTQSPMLGLMVAVFFYIIQLTENNILVPKVMEKTVGLNPIVSISVLMIGFQLAGVMGALLSIPVATAVSVFLEDIFEHKKAEEKGE